MREKLLGFGVSIVTYHTDLSDLLLSVETLCKSRSVTKVFLIENSPLPQYSINLFSHVSGSEKISIFYNPKNNGYVAHNIGISESENNNFKFHLILNADVSFTCETLDQLLNVMLNNENIGLLMPRICNDDASLQRVAKKLPTPFEMLLRLIGLSGFTAFDISKPSESKIPIFVPYLSGCFMLLSIDVVKIVGKMDERFFMYAEDIDLSRRIASKYEAIYYPNVSVVHTHGRASKKKIKLLWIHLKNVFLYFQKWGWILDAERRELNSRCGAVVILKNTTDK